MLQVCFALLVLTTTFPMLFTPFNHLSCMCGFAHHLALGTTDSARAILEACNWNLELAINMHVDGIESTDLLEMPANRNSNNLNSASTQSVESK